MSNLLTVPWEINGFVFDLPPQIVADHILTRLCIDRCKIQHFW